MCTVIISLNPDSSIPLFIGANRDEDPKRTSEHFALRDDKRALYPLDVRGGTWIGINKHNIFSAITNRDDTAHFSGKKSRGHLVLEALKAKSLADISKWADSLNPKDFNGFRLIASDAESIIIWESDGISDKVNILSLRAGLHIVTGFGVDTWDIPRCKLVKVTLNHLSKNEYRFEAYNDMMKVLSIHQTGKVEDDVCIHDPNESHQTVSSCCIEVNNFPHYQDIIVDAVKTAPCLAKEWDIFSIER